LPIDRKREEHERRITELSNQWDRQAEAQAADRKSTLEALRELLFERKYIDNLLATIEREAAGFAPASPGSAQAGVAGARSGRQGHA
jgi:hypothetical protein